MTCVRPDTKSPNKGRQLPKSDSDERKQLSTKTLSPEIVKKFQVVSLCEVARRLNVSRPTIYKLCRSGELEILTVDNVPYASGGDPLKLLGLVCITLASWNAYRERNGIV